MSQQATEIHNLTSNYILQDLASAVKDDVVFTECPEDGSTLEKGMQKFLKTTSNHIKCCYNHNCFILTAAEGDLLKCMKFLHAHEHLEHCNATGELNQLQQRTRELIAELNNKLYGTTSK